MVQGLVLLFGWCWSGLIWAQSRLPPVTSQNADSLIGDGATAGSSSCSGGTAAATAGRTACEAGGGTFNSIAATQATGLSEISALVPVGINVLVGIVIAFAAYRLVRRLVYGAARGG